MLDTPDRAELPYHFGVNLVSDVVVDGRVVVLEGGVTHGLAAGQTLARDDRAPASGGE